VVKFILRRALWSIPVLLLVIFLTFLLMKLIPGGPFTSEKAIPPEILANMNAKYGLSDPFYMQYLRYVWLALHGDLGVSMTEKGRTVTEVIRTSLPVSMHLGLMAFVVAMLIGIPAGIIAALKHNTWADYGALFYSSIGWAVPVFIIGPVFIWLFAIKLGWFPTSRWVSPKHWVLPTVVLGLALSAYFARLTRGAMLETLQQDYVRTARAKGLPNHTVVTRHVLRNSLIPVITQAGPLLGFVITGSFLTEYIFAIPGLGKYYVSSVSNRDYSVVMGLAVLLSVVIILANLLVDILYGILDPRIRYE
jgi:oligopeptide transport system permease protein